MGLLDAGGPWGWHEIARDVVVSQILTKLKDFETMTFDEILKNGSHGVAVQDICSDAQKRLVDIDQDDIDELFSLRLRGRQRIWGIRRLNTLKLIWWDPLHEVCPSSLRHT